MKSIFSYDSRLVEFANKIVDYIFLLFLWVLFSIPIITIGASTCAFHYAFNKAFIKERGYIWRSFINSFKENFKQATGVFLLQIIAGCILALSGYYTYLLNDNINGIFRWVFFACIVIIYLWTRYWFPYIACFKDKTKTVIKNCGLIMISNIHWSLLLFVLLGLWILCCKMRVYGMADAFILSNLTRFFGGIGGVAVIGMVVLIMVIALVIGLVEIVVRSRGMPKSHEENRKIVFVPHLLAGNLMLIIVYAIGE